MLRVPDGDLRRAYEPAATIDTPAPAPVAPQKPVPPVQVTLAGRHHTDRARILAVLREGPATTRQIADYMGILQTNVSAHLSTMWRAGVVKRKEIEFSRALLYSIGDAE